MIRRVSRTCVPVALNLYEIRVAKTDAGDFFRDVQKQRPEQYQGVYLVSPDGKVLSSQGREPAKPKTWTGDLIDVIDAGLKAYGGVTPRPALRCQAFKNRGVGERGDGSIVLAVTARWMLFGFNPGGLGKPAFDRIELSPSLYDSLALARVSKGSEWTVPEAVVQKFHRALSPTSDRNTLPTEDEVTRATLKAKVDRVKNGVAYIAYTGRVSGSHTGRFEPNKGKKNYSDLTLNGVGACEVKTGRLLAFTLVGDGRYRSFPPYDKEQKYGAVIEWER